MNKKNKLLFLLIILFLFAVNFAKAEVMWKSQPKDLYNLDDYIKANFSIKEPYNTYGVAEVKIVCTNNTLSFYKSPLTVQANQEKNVEVAPWPIEGISGECSLQASFNEEYSKTNEFIVTDNIAIFYEINNKYIKPVEELIIKGNATKSNSQPLNGFAEVSIQEITKQNIAVTDGSFEFAFRIPRNTAPKEYSLSLYVFERNPKGDITNKGTATTSLNVLSIPSTINITVNDSFKPPANIPILPVIYNQANTILNGSVLLYLQSLNGTETKTWMTESNLGVIYQLPSNATRGAWKITAQGSGLANQKIFYAQENEQVTLEYIYNGSGAYLIIKNLGNVRYQEIINISIFNDTSENITNIDLDIDLNKDFIYTLKAPNGTYNVSAGGFEFQNVFITGGVIRAELGKGILTKHPFLAAVIFFIILSFLIIAILNLQKSKKLARTPIKAAQQEILTAYAAEKYIPERREHYEGLGSEYTLELKKDNVICFVKAKNFDELQAKLDSTVFNLLKEFFFSTIEEKAKFKGGITHKVNDSLMLVLFSPSKLNIRPEVTGIKTATDIKNALEDYNKRLRNKLSFGIGIDTGKLFDTSASAPKVGTATFIARKLAEIANNEILISNAIYIKVSSEIKAETFKSIQVANETITSYKIKEGLQ